MKKTVGTLIMAIFAVVFCWQSTSAADLTNEYLKSISKYYDSPFNQVQDILDMGIAEEEIPVAFHIAGKAEAAVKEVVKNRLNGDSWMQISRKYSLDAFDYYIIVTGKVESKIYHPIFDKLNETPKNKRMEISLTDAEIINLVNLKMLYSFHDYSVYEIMAMRDYGKSFARINHQVYLARVEMNKKESFEAR